MQEIVAEGSLLLALLVALFAGAVSFFSPCVLPLVPGYLAYVGGSAQLAGATVSGAKTDVNVVEAKYLRKKMVFGTLLFVLGFTIVFVAFFSVFGSLGAWLATWESIITRALGALIILLGLVFIGFFKSLQASYKINTKATQGLWGAPILGAAFALGWTPCIGPTLSVIMVLSLQEGTAWRGALLGSFYCLGLGLPFVLIAFGFGFMVRAAAWVRKHMRTVNIFSGAVLIIIGFLMLTGVWSKIMYALQAWIGGFVLPI